MSDHPSPDPETPDVSAWRRAERKRLLAEREALPVQARFDIARAVGQGLNALLRQRRLRLSGLVISGYWPIRSEPDLRPWMLEQAAAGAQMALPVVAVRAAPLEFRPWDREAAMERGHWNILVPATAQTVAPDIVLAPLVGWDDAGFRLGYGGGYFDRTLAHLKPRPLSIGVGLQAARVATIHPQPHDIGLDAIVTEDGIQWQRDR